MTTIFVKYIHYTKDVYIVHFFFFVSSNITCDYIVFQIEWLHRAYVDVTGLKAVRYQTFSEQY